ncbi:hypothetical protein [Vibrio gallicus]|uniref:hypothetical protein n=1 Tax=Vibrio gallicus TaxID=190897 RepID=UPI0021C39F3F|nr:hypothetical protein [Vibrio gallicus]
MKKAFVFAMVSLSALSSPIALASNSTQCQIDKYNTYIDASIKWYQDLSELTSTANPELKQVSEWFVKGRVMHFELNRTAVSLLLSEQPDKVATELDVESWLQLSQQDIKALSQRDDELGQAAQASFAYRQAKPNPQNYEFRSALAELLSHPNKIQPALDAYNSAVQSTNQIKCN